MQCSGPHPYSITSSAATSSLSGKVRPSIRAVLRLTLNSNFVGVARSKGRACPARAMRCHLS